MTDMIHPSPSPDTGLYCPVERAAQMMQCHPQTVRRWIHRGKLRHLVTPHGHQVCIDDLPIPAPLKAQLVAEAKLFWGLQ